MFSLLKIEKKKKNSAPVCHRGHLSKGMLFNYFPPLHRCYLPYENVICPASLQVSRSRSLPCSALGPAGLTLLHPRSVHTIMLTGHLHKAIKGEDFVFFPVHS